MGASLTNTVIGPEISMFGSGEHTCPTIKPMHYVIWETTHMANSTI